MYITYVVMYVNKNISVRSHSLTNEDKLSVNEKHLNLESSSLTPG